MSSAQNYCLGVIFTLFLSLFLCSPSTVLGQTADFIVSTPTIYIQSSPENPGPNELVTLSIKSSTVDFTKATFTWKIDGQEVAKGKGTTSISTRTSSSQKIVAVSAVLPDGKTITASHSLAGNYVDLLWESEAYRPPFLKSRTPLLPQALARVVAIPSISSSNGSIINAENLYYTWTFNGRKMMNKSGFGKSEFYNDLSQRSNVIGVTVATDDGKSSAFSQITLVRKQPELFVYRVHPIYGILYGTAFYGALSVGEQEVELRAEPFGFSIFSNNDSDLSYTWLINGKNSGQNSPIVAIEGKNGTMGRIQVSARHAVADFQKALTAIGLAF